MLTVALKAALVKATDTVDQSQGATFGTPTATGDEAGIASQPAVALSIADLKAAVTAGLIKATDTVDQSAGTNLTKPTPTGNEAGTAAQPAVAVPSQTGKPAVVPTPPTPVVPAPVEELKAKLTASILAAKTVS